MPSIKVVQPGVQSSNIEAPSPTLMSTSSRTARGALLESKVVLVTGASSGIGRASAILFAREGAAVVLASRRVDLGQETAAIIQKEGGDAMFVRADVSLRDEVIRLIETAVQRYGRLDGAFNNAGVDGPPAPIVDCEEDDWDSIINTNLKGTFLLMKYELRQMVTQGSGSIVNMASMCSVIARPNRGAYNASRHGVVGLTKTAALEHARQGIKVNAVAPASVRTDIFQRSTQGDAARQVEYAGRHPIGRVAEPEEVAEAALWLLSDRSSFVMGATVMIDGGYTAQ